MIWGTSAIIRGIIYQIKMPIITLLVNWSLLGLEEFKL